MNKIFITPLLLFVLAIMFTYTVNAQPKNDLALARVEKLSGKYVFINCEPVYEYTVSFYVVKHFIWSYEQISTTDKIANMIVKKAINVSKKKEIDFDGVIINGRQKKDLAIKFNN